MGALPQAGPPAPYLRIAAELRARISSGELRAGGRVPSTRQITQEWGVATATASKVLAVLRREGLVRAVPGVGTVVEAPPAGAPRGRPARVRPARVVRAARRERGRETVPLLTRERVVRTAVAIADADGTTTPSMRAVAAELGVPTMALYRCVPSKEGLVGLMADAVFGAAGPPGGVPADWRGRLESAARRQWALYRRHSWLAGAVPCARLPFPHQEWAAEPLIRLGLHPRAVRHITGTLAGYVRGLALEPGRGPEAALALDALFDFGLLRLLDGLAAYVDGVS
ncbi:GntR family transcriptional regulator [Streptomyces sp. UNOC14_S4]|uniref:GntR family transcriptional regulator n=1 Tax=Streptomyces sp. UNOC14_S4 TaxID=2872340 RepID=UPI001E47A6D6|nr:GntR family transcriptional regulator [Streptomyces sp. UNOC14_S4]MCC3768466.1 GntR family transcriptional regulator [Streptomyces sp. UNOC14_S4]